MPLFADTALLGVHDSGSRRRDTAIRGLQIARNPAVENVVQGTSMKHKTVDITMMTQAASAAESSADS
jgi:hypothetical protein